MKEHQSKERQKGLKKASLADGETLALSLFHDAARRVPAYKDFLKRSKISPEKIKTYQDFTKYVPLINKKNYIERYSMAELSLDGNLFSNRIISASSGSSGIPHFWPRGAEEDAEGTAMFGEIYDAIFSMDQKPTLVVVCFAMGTWIAGTFTMSSTIGYIDQGRPVHVITPGLEKEEAVRAIKHLAKEYEQIVLVGYPPFVKDVIDEGTRAGVDWRHQRTRLLLASESFSEQWRDYVLSIVGSNDIFYDSSTIYGSADVGILGIETPLAIAARRVMDVNKTLCSAVFGKELSVLPTLTQFDPRKRHFEVVDESLVFTAHAGYPLVRYDIQDRGGVMSHDELTATLGSDLRRLTDENGIVPKEWDRPFVFVHGRKLFAVTIYGVKVYPEPIKAGLLDEHVRGFVTGKFTMATKNYSDMDQYFEINVELAKGARANDTRGRAVERAIVASLRALSSEFNKLHDTIGRRALPRIHLIHYGDPEYFGGGAKHKWVQR